MRTKLFVTAIIFALLITVFPACDAREAGSLKTLTKPYIAQYECTEAKLGDEDLLEKFEYITIVLEDKQTLKLIYKPKDGEKHVAESTYSLDTETRELTADLWILGYKFQQSTTVKNGKFTITQKIGDKQLIMNFKSK